MHLCPISLRQERSGSCLCRQSHQQGEPLKSSLGSGPHSQARTPCPSPTPCRAGVSLQWVSLVRDSPTSMDRPFLSSYLELKHSSLTCGSKHYPSMPCWHGCQEVPSQEASLGPSYHRLDTPTPTSLIFPVSRAGPSKLCPGWLCNPWSALNKGRPASLLAGLSCSGQPAAVACQVGGTSWVELEGHGLWNQEAWAGF